MGINLELIGQFRFAYSQLAMDVCPEKVHLLTDNLDIAPSELCRTHHQFRNFLFEDGCSSALVILLFTANWLLVARVYRNEDIDVKDIDAVLEDWWIAVSEDC